ncbi:MAG: hypothetical protein ACOC2H_02560 [Spirochaetota bacterium]
MLKARKFFAGSRIARIEEVSSRIVYIMVILLSLSAFLLQIKPFSELVSVIFCTSFVFYTVTVVDFYGRYRRGLRFGKADITLEDLQARFGLSRAESYIALLVKRGHFWDTILKRLDITENTLRSHLRKIYRKTFFRHGSTATEISSNSKLHRLTVMLNREQ